MDAPQYVHADVPSEFSVFWMFYYTHHSDMVSPQYVHIDVPSDYLCPWMFYDTHHMDMDIPQYVSPVKEKKGSNITILKRGKRHYEMWDTNQLHKNYLTRHVMFIRLTATNAVDYGMLAIHESNAQISLTFVLIDLW